MDESKPEQGGCLCGAIRYEYDRWAVVWASHCHCRDCQRSTGSGFTTFFSLPEINFRLLCGELKSFAVVGESGEPLNRSFCPDCGSPIFSTTSTLPGLVFVKAGTLDDPAWVNPRSSYWSGSAQPWAPVNPELEAHERNPS
jgi:hypothetical protein